MRLQPTTWQVSKLEQVPCEVFGSAQQMTGSFNRLLAKAPKRRLQRRGGAWQEGDFSFRGCLEKKKIKWNKARRKEFRVTVFWGSLGAARVGWEGGRDQTNFFLTKHALVEFVFDVRTTTRLSASCFCSALRSLFVGLLLISLLICSLMSALTFFSHPPFWIDYLFMRDADH